MTYRFNAEDNRQYELIDARLIKEDPENSVYEVGLKPDGKQKVKIKLKNNVVSECGGIVSIPNWRRHSWQKRNHKLLHVRQAGVYANQ